MNLIRGNYLDGQAPEIEWEHGFGGNNDEVGRSIILGNENGYVVAGYSYSVDGDVITNHGGSDIFVFKLSDDGEIEWKKNYGGSETDECFSIISANDGGYILVGATRSSDGDFTNNYGLNDLCILKIDDFGNLLWSKSYGGTGGEGGSKIITTSDGNYLIAGASSSNDFDVSGNNGKDDFWLLKIDIYGNILWQKTYGSSEWDIAYDIVETFDGYLSLGYAGAGDYDVSTINYGGPDVWLVKIDLDGEIIFDKTYGGSLTDVGFSLVFNGKDIFCIGTTYSNDFDITFQHGLSDCWILKIDSMGNLINQKTIGGGNFEEGFDLIKMNDNFILAGGSVSNDGDISENKGSCDYLFAEFDTTLNINWINTIGGSESDLAYSLIKSEDNAFAVTGYSFSNDFDVTETYLLANYWVVKMRLCDNHYFADMDNDGFGNIMTDTIACEIPTGYVSDSSDCNDANNLIFPTGVDICNAIDDNCNGLIDEDLIYVQYFIDEDGDNFGNSTIDSLWCNSIDGFVVDSTDCDDTNPNIHPGAEEILNGLDDDCDGFTDENLAINNTLLNAIKIYPNPAETILHIDYAGNSVCQFEIYSVTGEVIYQNELSSSTTIDISKFASGIYFLKIFGDDGEAGVKVVKE